MPRRFINAICLLALLFLAACGGAPGSDSSAPVRAMTDYLKALVEKDENRLTALVCPSFQADALLEYDSFSGVETSLDSLSCSQEGSEGGAALISCKGKIRARYVSETQEFDLGDRLYRVEKTGEEWKVCGYTLK